MQTYGERVAIARKLVGWSQDKLARELGIKQPSVFALEKSPATSSKHTFTIAEKTGVRPEWLERGEEPMLPRGAQRRSQEASIRTGQQGTGETIKVLGMAECGPDGWSLWNGDVVDTVPRPANLVGAKNAYAVFVTGDSMEPRYFAGEVVYIHPDKPVTKGAFVLVQIKPKEDGEPPRAVIKRLAKRTGAKWMLEQFNPQKTFVVTSDEMLSIHRVVGSGEV